jgi:hypothetical protein
MRANVDVSLVIKTNTFMVVLGQILVSLLSIYDLLVIEVFFSMMMVYVLSAARSFKDISVIAN